MVVKVAVSLAPSRLTEPTIATATSPAMRPYSSAVTPRSSLASARRLLRSVSILSILAVPARRSSGAIVRNRMKVMPEHSAGRLTDTSHGGSVLRFGGLPPATARFVPPPPSIARLKPRVLINR